MCLPPNELKKSKVKAQKQRDGQVTVSLVQDNYEQAGMLDIPPQVYRVDTSFSVNSGRLCKRESLRI